MYFAYICIFRVCGGTPKKAEGKVLDLVCLSYKDPYNFLWVSTHMSGQPSSSWHR